MRRGRAPEPRSTDFADRPATPVKQRQSRSSKLYRSFLKGKLRVKSQSFLFTALLLYSNFSLAGASIRISTDEDDCLRGWLSMDVTVIVDSEKFIFDPSCNFSFDRSFKTKSGVACTIKAGMCSGFSPRNKIEVDCEGSLTQSVPVKCPKK